MIHPDGMRRSKGTLDTCDELVNCNPLTSTAASCAIWVNGSPGADAPPALNSTAISVSFGPMANRVSRVPATALPVNVARNAFSRQNTPSGTWETLTMNSEPAGGFSIVTCRCNLSRYIGCWTPPLMRSVFSRVRVRQPHPRPAHPLQGHAPWHSQNNPQPNKTT